MLKIAFNTLGCKLNFAETATIARSIDKNKFIEVTFEQIADIYVINTCSVTDNADKKFRSLTRSLLRKNPDAKIIAIGCYAQLKAEEIAKIEGVSLVLGTKDKFNLNVFLDSLTNNTIVQKCDIENVIDYNSSFSISERTRSFLKIQDGCDYKCTYCTIPKARGVSRSESIENVIKNAKQIVDMGIKEIVLTGVNTGDYGKNLSEKTNLAQLLEELDKIENLERVRISSIEPNLITEQIIDIYKNSKKFVAHFHIPLQSGSDEVLALMKRRYNTKMYEEKINLIRKNISDVCIGADVIVGFPGESDELFDKTYEFLKQLDISYLHVFTYSERQNTPAATFSGKIPMQVRNNRSKILHLLSDDKKAAFYKKHKSELRPVLWESKEKGGLMSGFTDNYIKVEAPFDNNKIGKIELLKI